MIGDEAGEKFVNFSFHAAGQLTLAVLRGVFHAIQNDHQRMLQNNSSIKSSAKQIDNSEYTAGEKSMEELTEFSVKEKSSIQCVGVEQKELHGFDQYAENYGLRFSLVREKNDPTHYVFSFMQKDVDKFKHAMEDFLKDGQEHGDLARKIHEAQKEAFTVNQTHAKERGPKVKVPHQKVGPSL